MIISRRNVGKQIVGSTAMIGKEQFIQAAIRFAHSRGFKVESNARTGMQQIDFGNKKLHAGHLRAMYPLALLPNANIPALIERVAPGRPCTHKPMREFIAQLRAQDGSSSVTRANTQ